MNQNNSIEKIVLLGSNNAFCPEDCGAKVYNIHELEQSIHQELQKAKEEERERIIYITMNTKDAFMFPLTERRWLNAIQSELDQPIS
jgi:hypothetical protein